MVSLSDKHVPISHTFAHPSIAKSLGSFDLSCYCSRIVLKIKSCEVSDIAQDLGHTASNIVFGADILQLDETLAVVFSDHVLYEVNMLQHLLVTMLLAMNIAP